MLDIAFSHLRFLLFCLLDNLKYISFRPTSALLSACLPWQKNNIPCHARYPEVSLHNPAEAQGTEQTGLSDSQRCLRASEVFHPADWPNLVIFSDDLLMIIPFSREEKPRCFTVIKPDKADVEGQHLFFNQLRNVWLSFFFHPCMRVCQYLHVYTGGSKASRNVIHHPTQEESPSRTPDNTPEEPEQWMFS